MPALVMCRRRWLCASDDFVLTPCAYALVSAVLAVLLALKFSELFDIHRSDSCETLRTSMLLLFIVHCVTALVLLTLSLASSRGSIVKNAAVRETFVPLLLMITVVVWGLHVIIAAVSLTRWLDDASHSCDSDSRAVVEICFVASFVMPGMQVLGALWGYDASGHHDMSAQWRQSGEYVRQWEGRFRKLFFFARPSKSNEGLVYNDLAHLFANMFRNVDLVPSDFAAGMLLMRRRDKEDAARRAHRTSHATLKYSGRTSSLRHSTEFTRSRVPRLTPEQLLDLEELEYYTPYVNAAYGWPMVFLAYPLTFVFRMFPWLFSHNNAVKMWLKERANTKLVHFCSNNKEHMIPYFIAVDGARKTIVVSVRGTLSIDDALTDIWADKVPFHAAGLPSGFVHKGMYESARRIELDINNKGHLRNTLQKHPSYTLVMTGHSLGGGVASILAAMWREKHPNLRCLAFSPPGAMFTLELARAVKPFVVSVVVGKDIVARLSERAVQKFRDEMIDVLSTSARPKFTVTWCPCLKCEEHDGKSSAQEMVSLQKALSDARLSDPREARTPMYPPGRLYHMMKTHSEGSCLGLGPRTSCYVPLAVDVDAFQSIRVSPVMVRDHMPYNVKDVIHQTLRRVKAGDVNPVYDALGANSDGPAPVPTSPESPFVSLLEVSFTQSIDLGSSLSQSTARRSTLLLPSSPATTTTTEGQRRRSVVDGVNTSTGVIVNSPVHAGSPSFSPPRQISPPVGRAALSPTSPSSTSPAPNSTVSYIQL
eukprot:PhM_4_TR10327/c0_g1_i1/m.20028/K13806/DAGL; sn1-specific diacylglycerol lipase